MASKSAKNDIPADMWLHVAADALARYAAGGGKIETAISGDGMGGPALVIVLPILPTDPRLPSGFVALFSEEPAADAVAGAARG